MLINSNIEKLYLGTKENNSPVNIFIVDDSAFMVKTINKMLVAFGCNVVGSANDGDAAIQNFFGLKNQVDLVTLDISMPKRDGLSALPELLKINPSVKVVMISALGDKEKVKQAIVLGAKHFIVKPFKPEKVYDIIKWVLDH